MPVVNVNYQRTEDLLQLDAKTRTLTQYFSEALSCTERKLKPNEISLRYHKVEGNGMLRNVEFDIMAFAYPERVKRQDEICRDARVFIEKEVPSVAPVYVFLQLSEFGMSG